MNTVQLSSQKPENARPATVTSHWRDSIGIIASVGCAIHCAAMPFVIAYLPAMGLSFLADEAFHKWMALICFLIAIAAFVPGIRKHGNWIPISVASVGLIFITVAAFGLAGECCASCSPATPAAGEACVDCEQCESSVTAVTEPTITERIGGPKAGNDLLATLAPWITPLGGVLLVSSHLMNRSCGNQCSCCTQHALSTTDN